jgi:hypothetical protein
MQSHPLIRRAGGDVFGELGFRLTRLVRLEARVGVSTTRNTLPAEATDVIDQLLAAPRRLRAPRTPARSVELELPHFIRSDKARVTRASRTPAGARMHTNACRIDPDRQAELN